MNSTFLFASNQHESRSTQASVLTARALGARTCLPPRPLWSALGGSQAANGAFLATVSSVTQEAVLTRRPTILEGLYSGLGTGAAMSASQLDAKMKLLVEAPAAVEDALASLLDHHDATLQVRTPNSRGRAGSLP